MKTGAKATIHGLFSWLRSMASVGPLSDGFTANNRGDYATALRCWRPFAERGDAVAQNSLGFMYDKGRGVLQDYDQAVYWFRMAAEQGFSEAQYNLGYMYDNGCGVPQDCVQAHIWYNLAAARSAQGDILEIAIKNRNNLNPVGKFRSHTLTTVRAAQENIMKRAIKNRDAVTAKMTPAQIAEAQRLAREWKPK